MAIASILVKPFSSNFTHCFPSQEQHSEFGQPAFIIIIIVYNNG